MKCLIKKLKMEAIKFLLCFPIKDFSGSIPSILILVILSFYFSKLGLKNGQYSAIYFILLGTLVSAIFTIFIDLLKIIKSNYNEIFNIIALYTSIFDFLREIFLEFLCHPFKDELCKKGEDIIYVSPITSEKFLNEKELLRYQKFINSIDNNTLTQYFDEVNTRKLIERLKAKLYWFQSTESTLFALKNGIQQNIITLFIHFSSLLLQLINADSYKWQDTQIRSMLIDILK